MSPEDPDTVPGSGEAFRTLRAQLDELSGICNAIAGSSDLDKLWRRIVKNARLMLNVDGCTFYRVRDRRLHFEIVLSGSLGLLPDAGGHDPQRFPPIPLYVDDDDEQSVNQSSVAARAAVEGAVFNIADVSRQPGYARSLAREFDQRLGYRTRSMLTIPVRFQQEPVTGVLQLINAKNARGEIVEFDTHLEAVATALASLIAIAGKLR